MQILKPFLLSVITICVQNAHAYFPTADLQPCRTCVVSVTWVYRKNQQQIAIYLICYHAALLSAVNFYYHLQL